MTFESMISTYCLADRIAYYSSDIEAIAESLENIRLKTDERTEQELDADMRILYLALYSIVHSLDKEVDLALEGRNTK